MTAKEFVKQHFPTVKSEKHISGKIKGMQRVYWLIRVGNDYMYYAEGETESKAWKSAKQRIIDSQL